MGPLLAARGGVGGQTGRWQTDSHVDRRRRFGVGGFAFGDQGVWQEVPLVSARRVPAYRKLTGGSLS